MINLKDIYVIGNDYSLVALDKEFFFLPNSTDGIAEEKLFALNSTAYLIASYIDGKKSVADIVNIIAERTNVCKSIIERDIIELMNKLLEKKIIC